MAVEGRLIQRRFERQNDVVTHGTAIGIIADRVQIRLVDRFEGGCHFGHDIRCDEAFEDGVSNTVDLVDVFSDLALSQQRIPLLSVSSL